VQLTEFLQQNNIDLPQELIDLCHEGIAYMRDSLDVNHNHTHVELLLDNLTQFLKYEPEIKLNYPILLPAICWHDVWKASRVMGTGKIKLLYENIYDGKGSEKMFRAYAKEIRLRIELLEPIAYCIRSHSSVSSLFPKSRVITNTAKLRRIGVAEARVLRDLDALEVWNIRRFDSVINSFEYVTAPLLKVAVWWFKNITLKSDENRFYFDWSKKEFKQRLRLVIEHCINLIDEYEKIIPQETINSIPDYELILFDLREVATARLAQLEA
jgi:hypothetical protein